MITPATRQDVQNAIDRTRNTIMGTMLTRSDLQSVVNQVRNGLVQDLNNLHAENQLAMRQATNSRAQIQQRIGALEASLARIEQSLRELSVEHSKTSLTVGKMHTDNGYLFQRT